MHKHRHHPSSAVPPNWADARARTDQWSGASAVPAATRWSGVPTTTRWSGATRASDQDRAELVDLLGVHAGAGRLTLAEFDDRAARAYAATTVSDLGALIVDLPAPPVDRPPPVRSSWPGAAPFAGIALVGVICLAIWVLTSLAHGRLLYFWPIWVVGPWAVTLFSRGLRPARSCSPRRPSVPR